MKICTAEGNQDVVFNNTHHHKLDLSNAIEKGKYPSWTTSVQIMVSKDAELYRWNIFDMTKIWPHSNFPLRPFRKMILNKNSNDFFEDVEQATFSPSNIVPSIAISADPIPQQNEKKIGELLKAQIDDVHGDQRGTTRGCGKRLKS
ncbi:catalase A [Clarireedia jacksonii]